MVLALTETTGGPAVSPDLGLSAASHVGEAGTAGQLVVTTETEAGLQAGTETTGEGTASRDERVPAAGGGQPGTAPELVTTPRP